MIENVQLCPRCELRHFTPYNAAVEMTQERFEKYPFPALSRVAQIYICSWCGQDEAMRDFRHEAPVPPDEWPIRGTGFGQGAAATEGEPA